MECSFTLERAPDPGKKSALLRAAVLVHCRTIATQHRANSYATQRSNRGTILVITNRTSREDKGMSEELQALADESTEVFPDAAQRAAVSAPSLGTARYSPSFRYGRSARSYCADTAWIWERARFLCSTPE